MTTVEHYWEKGRYEPVEMDEDDRGRRPWRVSDGKSRSGWAEGPLDLDGRYGPLEFTMQELAEEWIGRTKYTTEGKARAR